MFGFVVFIVKKRTILLEKYLQKTNMLKNPNQLLKGRVQYGITCKRSYYMWLNFVFNRVDSSRLEEFGPDRVAAEWVLRNGGGVKFLHHDGWLWNYNSLAMGPRDKYKLQKINGKGTCITTGGLLHLEGLKYLDYLNLHGCKYVGDVSKILPVKDTLEELDISLCPAITDISSLGQLKNLKKLNLFGTTRIKDRETAIQDLQRTIPDCDITD